MRSISHFICRAFFARRFALKYFAMAVVSAAAAAAFGLDAAHAAGTYSAFSRVPERFRQDELTLSSRGLGDTCYSRGVMPDGTVCNASRLGEVKDATLIVRGYIGNGYAALSSADSLLNKPITRDYLRTLFSQNSTTSVEGDLGLVFAAKHFQAEFSPYRVQYASEVHNPNFPILSLHAALERRFALSGGLDVLPGLTAGARLRIVDRKFLHSEFSALDPVAESPETYLPVNHQTGIFVDPSLNLRPIGAPWKLSASVALENLGKVNQAYDEYPTDPDLQFGFGVEPPVPFGKLKLGVDFRDVLYTQSFQDTVRLGASYAFGLVEVMAGGNRSIVTGGFMLNLSFIQAGVVYEFYRDDYENGSAQSRIATEASIRL